MMPGRVQTTIAGCCFRHCSRFTIARRTVVADHPLDRRSHVVVARFSEGFPAGDSAFAAAGLARRGIEPALPLAYVTVFNETIGAEMLAVGFLTRVVAVMIAVEMAVIAWTFFPKFGWDLAWLRIRPDVGVFAVALRGGGPYSVDRRLGWEI
jgi:uncharacterized membrane protein YphA (DoxX/SURF4 family)